MAKLLKANDGDESANPSSAETVASIDDLLTQIIQCLPLKKIVQLKLVSKYWKHLIMNPNLCLLRNQLPAVGLIYESLDIGNPDTTSDHSQSYIIFLDKPMRPKMIRPKDEYRTCRILHSCNGLLLCVSNQTYYVCNPTTRKCIALPEIKLDHDMMIHGMYLAFDPSKTLYNYRVVCVLRSCRGLLHLFEVYSSRTGSWKKVGEPFEPGVDLDFEDGVYWNGAIHWVNVVTEPREIVYFNLDCDQTHKVFPTPPLRDEHYRGNDYYFGESCNHLYFVDAYVTACEFIVYEMKMDYSEWFVKYTVNMNYFERFIKRKCIVPDAPKWYTVVCGKNDDDSFLVITIGNITVQYNFERKTWKLLFEFELTAKDRSVIWGSLRPFQYTESICPV